MRYSFFFFFLWIQDNSDRINKPSTPRWPETLDIVVAGHRMRVSPDQVIGSAPCVDNARPIKEQLEVVLHGHYLDEGRGEVNGQRIS